MPDVWAIDQVFPIVPVQRLDTEPDRRGVIADLTCDSDGRIDNYVGAESLNPSTANTATAGSSTGSGTPKSDPSAGTGADNPAKAKVVIIIKPPTE